MVSWSRLETSISWGADGRSIAVGACEDAGEIELRSIATGLLDGDSGDSNSNSSTTAYNRFQPLLTAACSGRAI